MHIEFTKMHGLGNDFVIIDSRHEHIELNDRKIRLLGHRNLGIGFDQLVVINRPSSVNHTARLKFWNSDGSTSPTCGNATRCVADFIMREKQSNKVTLCTDFSEIECIRVSETKIATNLGDPLLDWNSIPLSEPCDTLKLPIKGNPIASSIGNPHCTFFVKNLEKVSISKVGVATETNKLFPEKTNVQLAQILDNSTIKIKVWERGCGETLASGSSACAVAVAAVRLDLLAGPIKVEMDGGDAIVNWKADGIWLTAETETVFTGRLSKEFFHR